MVTQIRFIRVLQTPYIEPLSLDVDERVPLLKLGSRKGFIVVIVFALINGVGCK